jgi:serine protease inhibitor
MKKTISILISIIMIAGLLAGCVNPDGNRSTGIGGNKQASFDLSKIDSGLIGGNEIFAFNIFQKINSEDGDKSIFISPLSISTALAMTYNGARTTTAEAMAEALQYKGIELENLDIGYKNLLAYLNNVDPKVQLNISNSIWFRKGEEIRSDFLSTNKDNFNAYISEIDFQDIKAADTINDWISKATKSKIDKMIEPPISPDVIMYLINAIYFKGQWTKQFDKKLTFTGTFNKEDGKKQEVQMMSRKGKIEYGEVGKSKIVRLPYGNEKTAMYCILPEQDVKINDYIEEFSFEKWKELQESLSKNDDVILHLPRFKLEYGIKNLNDSLTALGMGKAFSDSADFSGIRDGIYISRVLHKAVIEVNEEGSEAAGVTVVEMKETAAMEPIMFIADRPFVFLIADDETGTILFMGKLMEV